MVSDKQVRRLRKLMSEDKRLSVNAAKVGIDEKTARKYLGTDRMPGELAVAHTWRTRVDPFEAVWAEVRGFLELNAGLEAKTLFEYLQRTYPGRFADGQLRSLQRGIRVWRALEGPAKEVFFEQVHEPGYLCQSDFTYMHELGITIAGEVFDHLMYHFVLTYSNWETGTLCFSESYESLSEGLQSALWELGMVPQVHRTDRLTAAVSRPSNPQEFTQRYAALLRHYQIEGRKIRVAQPNENGDIEQRHHRFKRAVDQALMLRGSREFGSRVEYESFLRQLFVQLNSGRMQRLQEERARMRPLPTMRLDSFKKLPAVRVSRGSTIKAGHNLYSVDSRLIGETVTVRLYAEHLEVWYAARCIERIPRLRGEGKHRIQYRHVIDWLVRKPAAFENYRYRNDLFPGSRFRKAYDQLKTRLSPNRAAAAYLAILKCAAEQGERVVDRALEVLFDQQVPLSSELVQAQVFLLCDAAGGIDEVQISPVDVSAYDQLLESQEGAYAAGL